MLGPALEKTSFAKSQSFSGGKAHVQNGANVLTMQQARARRATLPGAQDGLHRRIHADCPWAQERAVPAVFATPRAAADS